LNPFPLSPGRRRNILALAVKLKNANAPRSGCGRAQQRPDPFGVLRRCRVIDDHAEIRAAIDGESGEFECVSSRIF